MYYMIGYGYPNKILYHSESAFFLTNGTREPFITILDTFSIKVRNVSKHEENKNQMMSAQIIQLVNKK